MKYAKPHQRMFVQAVLEVGSISYGGGGNPLVTGLRDGDEEPQQLCSPSLFPAWSSAAAESLRDQTSQPHATNPAAAKAAAATSSNVKMWSCVCVCAEAKADREGGGREGGGAEYLMPGGGRKQAASLQSFTSRERKLSDSNWWLCVPPSLSILTLVVVLRGLSRSSRALSHFNKIRPLFCGPRKG